MGLGLRVRWFLWVWLVVGVVVLGSWGVARELSLWLSAPSVNGLVELWTDGPAVDLVVNDPVGALAGSTLEYEVQVDGVRLADVEARALLVSLLDTLQLLQLRNESVGLGRQVMVHVPYTRLRGERGQWMAYYPFTVATVDGAETNQSRALLDEALGKAPGLDNERVRRVLWRDVMLDLVLLGSLREAVGSQAIGWLQVGDDPRVGTSAQAARAFALLQEVGGIADLALAVPERLSDVVTVALRAGVPRQVLQDVLDASMVEGLYAGERYGAAGVRQGSPFGELLDRAEAFGLALDVFSLVTQVGGDVFDGVAMQLSANAAADARLSFLEDVLADDCATDHALVDGALCGGLALAREEFDVLSEAVLTGMVHAIAQALHDGDSLLTYAGLTASIVGHVASLHGAGAITTSASVAGAGVLVLKSLASIADEFQLVRRAFLFAHLNQLLLVRLGDVGDAGPAEVRDVSVWARSREHMAVVLLIEWGFFHTLHEGYTASALSPAGLLHWLTQWIHGSREVVEYLAEREAAALGRLTDLQPITSLVTLQPAGLSPSSAPAVAGTPTEVWTHQLGTSGQDEAWDVAFDGHGRVVVVGRTDGALAGTTTGSFDAFVRVYDVSGGVAWEDQFGTSGAADIARSVAVDAAGHLVVVGTWGESQPNSDDGGQHRFVRAYDKTGELVWEDQSGATGHFVPSGVAVGSPGRVIVVGEMSGAAGGAFAKEYDVNGRLVREDQIGDVASCVVVDALGRLIVAGQISVRGFSGASVRVYDSDRRVDWEDEFGVGADASVAGLAVDTLGRVIAVGYSKGSESSGGSSEAGAFVRVYHADGVVLWQDHFGVPGQDMALDVAVDALDRVIVVGGTGGFMWPGTVEVLGPRDAFMRVYDSRGVLLWEERFGSDDQDEAVGVALSGLGEVVVASNTYGSAVGPAQGELDVFLRVLELPLGTAGVSSDRDEPADARAPAFEAMPSHVRFGNTKLSDEDVGSGSRLVSFDISWPESWRGPNRPSWVEAVDNWDAVWVFLKYRVDGGAWRHANLASSGHVVPNGVFVEVSPDGLGAILYRSEVGYGVFSAAGVGLAWDFATAGVREGAVVDVQPHAIEMVYVPQGSFSLGSGGSSRAEFRAGGTRNQPYVVDNQSSISFGNEPGQLMWTETGLSGSPVGGTDDSFPTGFAAFYVMKHELTQGQYVDFLNSLTQGQASARHVTSSREPQITGSIAGAYLASSPYIAMNFISWADALAYADWAGLRPMTELEYEKAARGPMAPVRDEYAWGSTSIEFATGLLDVGTIMETPIPANANVAFARYPPADIRFPVRVGSFAAAGRSRRDSGAGFYGSLELSGNVAEFVVPVGHAAASAFDGSHGDGLLDAGGNADVRSWPDLVVDGARLRGGGFGTTSGVSVSSRETKISRAREGSQGWRGVRSAP